MLPIEYLPPAELVDADFPVLMNTGRMLYHYNVSTRISDTLEAIAPVERVEIHPEDAKKYDLDKDSIVRVTSRRGTMTANVRITKRVQLGTIFSTFHFHESPVNELTNSAYDPVTKTAEYKVTAVKLVKEA
jgi:predicted molibdopterin-dependent oxidoreductase YjgC